MARRRYTAEEIIDKFRKADIALAASRKMTAALRKIWVSEQAYGPWYHKTSIANDLAC